MIKGNENVDQSSAWIKVQRLLNTLNHVFISLIGIYITILAYEHSFKNTAQHAFFTTIGFHVLVAEALMSHYHINELTRSLSHRNKSRVHGVLQFLGGLMILFGVFGKFSSTEIHFTTLHGKIGLAATFMCCASMLGGLVNYFQPKFAHKLYTPSEIRFRHNFFGLITFTLGMTTIFLGYRTKFFDRHVDAEWIPALSFATLSVYFLTVFAPILSLLKKLKYRNKLKSR